MAKRYLKTIVSRLKTSSPNTHVSPSNGSSTAEPLRPTFAFLSAVAAVAFAVLFTTLENNALRKARMKITKLIWNEGKIKISKISYEATWTMTLIIDRNVLKVPWLLGSVCLLFIELSKIMIPQFRNIVVILSKRFPYLPPISMKYHLKYDNLTVTCENLWGY